MWHRRKTSILRPGVQRYCRRPRSSPLPAPEPAEEVAVWPLYWTKVIMAARKGLKVEPRSDQWTLAQSVSKK